MSKDNTGVMWSDGMLVMCELDNRGVAQGVVCETPEVLDMLQEMVTYLQENTDVDETD